MRTSTDEPSVVLDTSARLLPASSCPFMVKDTAPFALDELTVHVVCQLVRAPADVSETDPHVILPEALSVIATVGVFSRASSAVKSNVMEPPVLMDPPSGDSDTELRVGAVLSMVTTMLGGVAVPVGPTPL